MSIALEGISKTYDSVRALRGIDATVERNTLAALLGPSGCGKSTLLRIIAGFDHADAGRVLIDGTDVSDVPARRRGIGFVAQHYALFPHMTVGQNVSFALDVRGTSREQTTRRVSELLALVRLEGYESRLPRELSGGQKQRVALARALAPEPSILLLDEPFAALDLHVRRELRAWLRDLHERTHVTTILVTHDADEAMELADNIVLLEDGVVALAVRDALSGHGERTAARRSSRGLCAPARIRSRHRSLRAGVRGHGRARRPARLARRARCRHWRRADPARRNHRR